jgi:tetratricopeptide (TPR) repeat protein
MLALGSALVHAARGRDEDGAAMLHRAIAAAEEASDRPTQAAAHRELGYVEVLRGEYPRGQVWLGRARELADGDPLELSRVHAVTGALLADEGKHLQAADAFEEAIELCRSVAHGRQLAWSHTAYGQSQVLCGDLDEAERNLEAGLEYTRAERWTAFRSWPEALLAEVWLRTGRVELAAEAFEHAFALGCSVEDACWEAYAVRGLGLLEAAGGDLEGAIKLMEDALERCLRERDTHQWIRAYVLDALCAVGVAARDVRASAWARDLASFAGTRGMREFAVCAYLYLRDLGETGAREAAGAIAVEVENPRLREIVAADGPRGLAELLGGPTVP